MRIRRVARRLSGTPPPALKASLASEVLLIFGASYSGSRIAQRASDSKSFERIYAAAHADPNLRGVHHLPFSGDQPIADESILPRVTHLLSTIPPYYGQDQVLEHYADHFKTQLPNLRWVGYLSTVDIYGSHADGWVDERSAPSPDTQLAKVRLSTEDAWCNLGLPLHLFRVGELYGPNRGPQTQLRTGKSVCIRRTGFTNPKTHVDDLAHVVLTSMFSSPSSADESKPAFVCNVVDAELTSPEQMLAAAGELMGCEPALTVDYDEVEPRMTAPAREWWTRSLRVKSVVRDTIGAPPLFGDVREGLEAILREERAHDLGMGPTVAVAPLSAQTAEPLAADEGPRAPAEPTELAGSAAAQEPMDSVDTAQEAPAAGTVEAAPAAEDAPYTADEEAPFGEIPAAEDEMATSVHAAQAATDAVPLVEPVGSSEIPAAPAATSAPTNHWGDDMQALLDAVRTPAKYHADLLAAGFTPASIHKTLGRRGAAEAIQRLEAAGLPKAVAGEIVDEFF